jgi:hypothetical protein
MIRLGTNSFYAGGLAGYLENTAVSNIVVDLNLQVEGGFPNAGLVAGYSTGGTIGSFLVEGTLDAVAVGTLAYVGGVVGNVTSTSFENGTSAVTRVSAEASNGNVFAGGLIGTFTTGGSMVSCGLKADHPVTVQGKTTSIASANNVYAGGIYGGTGANIVVNKCVVDVPEESEIIAETETAFGNCYAGGIAGQGSGTISNSYVRRCAVRALAPIVGTTVTNIVAGGIAGTYNASPSGALIAKCFSNADVTTESALPTNANSSTAAGGVIGVAMNYLSIEDSGSSGTVRVVSTSDNAASTAAFAGGIAGLSKYLQANLSIERCAALNGSITVESVAAVPYAYRILGGVQATSSSGTAAVTLDAIRALAYLTLRDTYGLPDETVKTKQGDAVYTVVPHLPHNAGFITGKSTAEKTQAFFETSLGWNFSTDWDWDAETNLPVPRYK